MAKMIVVATDGLGVEAQEMLRARNGIELRVNPATAKTDLLSALLDADLAIIRSATVLDEPVLSVLPNLKGVLRAGVGIDNIDLKKSEELGIYVWNAPTGNFQATAELALGLLFAVSRKIVFATENARSGKWVKKEIGPSGRQMLGSTLGIFGAGNIGLRVAKMAKAIGMNVLVYDPVFNMSEENPFTTVSFDELLKNSDFISIHAPLLESTKHKFDLPAFKKMKKGALIVNAARGGIIKEVDLLQALQEGILGGAGLDVFEKEPFDTTDPMVTELLKHERLVVTPHIGAQTAESQKAVGRESAEKIIALHLALSEGIAAAPQPLNQPKNPRWSFRF